MISRRVMWKIVIALSTAVLVAASALVTINPTADQVGALAGTIQAVAVIPILGIGLFTLLRDSSDRRVDRTLALHEELMTGEVWRARMRLVEHLHQGNPGTPISPVSRHQLRTDTKLCEYNKEAFGGASPVFDANLIVRYFERADAARRARAVDETMFLDLIGRHAHWWNLAFLEETTGHQRRRLYDLACWTERNSARIPYWDPTHRGAFPNRISVES